MPATPRMRVTLDVTDYAHLPHDVRMRFDGWLKAEALVDKLIVKLTLAEGAVIVERLATHANGKVRVADDESLVIETARYPVKTLPPMDAFDCCDSDEL